MGGKGSGGSRIGAGRKRKDEAMRALGGFAGKRGGKKAPAAALPVLPPPADLPADQQAVWLELAPYAAAQRTLIPQTALAFRDLVEAIVLKRDLHATIQANGLTYLKVTVDGSGQEHDELKANPLLPHHRGLMQRVEAGLMRFRLSPVGKELIESEKPKDEWSDFDGPDTVN